MNEYLPYFSAILCICSTVGIVYLFWKTEIQIRYGEFIGFKE
jgi:hypothetical protein